MAGRRLGVDAVVRSWVRSMRARNLTETTITHYTSSVDQLLDHARTRGHDPLTRAAIEECLGTLARERKPATVSFRYRALQQFTKWLAEEEELPADPMARMRPPQVPGAKVLGENHRFRDPVYRDAAELLRDHQAAAAVEVLRAQGMVSDHHSTPVEVWSAMVEEWLTLRGSGARVLMLATERTTVAQVNQIARARLIARGDLSRRSRTYRAPDDHRAIRLAVGDEVILRRNLRIAQPDGSTVAVRNGMTGRIVATRRRSLTVDLDTAHRTPGEPAAITLQAGYVGEHVEYGYARTVDPAQGATVDHSLFAPSTGSSAERAYVALSRGRLTNRIYATRDRTWIDAIGRGRSHALAVDQTPTLDRTPHGPWDAEPSHTTTSATHRSNSTCRPGAPNSTTPSAPPHAGLM